ncbi:MDR family MFS transporter [Solitalea lacus]|uniref:MDR family MFS transporter n=1 Tax=Solitalea lacus TaxID=2911172 RepID=UPI001EDB4F9E|nr:MFS transporter [Solitalea lacus]UKJ05830.1 MFS transporter [Solitalea lacus]
MASSILTLYKNAYGGLSRSTWLLALVMLINRAGTMVLPFMTVYLTQNLHYSIEQAGMVMACFGAGAIIGAYFGGQLTDKFGFSRLQFWSLFLNGFMFFVLGQMQSIWAIGACFFVLSVIGEAFRPANAAAVVYYSEPEKRTRSYSLNRLAVNLGWAIGPAVGGLLASIDYNLLFWVDGFTCIAAALLLKSFLPPVKTEKIDNVKSEKPEKNVNQSAYKDKHYLFFIFLVALNAICFFQMFSILPVYYKEVVLLDEWQIGLVMGLNGLVIAFVEMVLVFKLEGKNHPLYYISKGVLFTGLSFVVFNLFGPSPQLVVLSILLITFGEMLSMPFMNSYWINRSADNNRGQYAALYTIAYSIAQVIAPTFGSRVVQTYGFNVLWYAVGGICILTFSGFYWLNQKTISTSKITV